MKIVIVSDSHGDNGALQRVYLKEYDAEVFLHAGDSVAPSESIVPFVGVRGNCDGPFREDYPLFRLIKTPFGLLKIQHYPLFGASSFDDLKSEGVAIFVHGHTHIQEEEEVSGVKIFCPGSVSFPRDNEKGTYLVLDVSPSSVQAAFKTL